MSAFFQYVEFVQWATGLVAKMANGQFKAQASTYRHSIGRIGDDIRAGRKTLGRAEDEFLKLLQ